MAYDSVETWRLYSAEGAVRQINSVSSLMSASTLTKRITRTTWWRSLPYAPAIHFRAGGHAAGGMVMSHITPQDDSEVLPTSWTLSVHPQRATERTVIHELAHAVAPRFQRLPDGPLQRVPLHGRQFAGVYVEMLREFSVVEDPSELIDAMTHFGVQWATPEEWRTAVIASLALEQQLADGQLVDEYEPPSLGKALRQARTEAGWSELDLAARAEVPVGLVRDAETTTLHRSTPDELRMAVAVGLDPILLTEQLGFSLPYDTTEWVVLSKVNKSWTDLVEDLNQLAAERPSWWEA